MQHASGADIVSIFLYEEASRKYYAPFATGQPQESLLDSLADMTQQLDRYLADQKQGKVPDELGVHHYGSTVWLTVTRQKLVARDAPSEIDSTFIRRYQVQATIGLALLFGDRLLGLVYLNYRTRERIPDAAQLESLEGRANAAARAIQAVLADSERSALEGLGRLTSLLTGPIGDPKTDAKELRRLLSIALADLLLASDFDAAAIYQFAGQRTSLELVTAHAPVAAPPRIEREDAGASWESVLRKAVAAGTARAALHAVPPHPLATPAEPPRSPAAPPTIIAAGSRPAERGAPPQSAGVGTQKRVPRWALEEERELAADDVLVYVARTRQAAVVGALAAGAESDRSDVISGAIPESATWFDIPVVWSDGTTMAHVAACLIGEPKGKDDRGPARGQAPFTLAGEVFQSGGHADLIRVFLPFGSDLRATP